MGVTSNQKRKMANNGATKQKKAPKPNSNFVLGVTFKALPGINQIRKMHPKIVKVNVVARTYCEINFKSAQDRTEALIKFEKLVASGKLAAIKPIDDAAQLKPKHSEHGQFYAALNRLIGNIEQVSCMNPKRQVTNGVFIRDLPRDIRQEDIEALVPDAMDVTVLVPRQPTKLAGVALTMPSPADALKLRKGKKLMIRGQPYKPEFQRDGPMTVRQSKRLALRGHFVQDERKSKSKAPRYFMETGGAEIKEEPLDQEEVDEIMKIYD